MFTKRKIAAILLLILIIFFSLNIFLRLHDKNSVVYFVEAEHYQEECLNNTILGTITLISNNPYKISVYASTENWSSGNLEFKLFRDSSNVIYSTILYPENLETNLLSIDIPNLDILEAGSYFVSFTENNIDSDIYFFKESNDAFKEIQYYHLNKFIFYFCIIILNFLFIVIFLVVIHLKNAEQAFLFLAIMTGIIFVFLIPPYTAPDELWHFARSFDIASGNFVCKDYETREEFDNQTMPICEFPKELFELKLISQDNGINYTRETNTQINILAFKNIASRNFSGETVRIPIHGDHTTSSVAFLPQILSILLARFLNVPPIIMFYMARLGNLLAAIAIAYLGLKKIPRYKIMYMILYFAPGMIFLRSTSSTDGLLYSLILLFIAQIVYLMFAEVTFWEDGFLLLTVTAICITLIKMPYFIIYFLVLLVSKKRFVIAGKESKYIKYLYLIGLLSVCFTIYSISHHFLDYNSAVISTLYASSAEIDTSYILYAISHIFSIANMFFQTGIVNFHTYFFDAISFPNAGYLVMPYLLMCLAAAIYGEHNSIIKKQHRIIFFLIGLGTWLIVCAAFYFIGPGPDIGYIWGLQGRYMYPALILIFIALSNKNENKSSLPSLEACVFLTGIYALSL